VDVVAGGLDRPVRVPGPGALLAEERLRALVAPEDQAEVACPAQPCIAHGGWQTTSGASEASRRIPERSPLGHYYYQTGRYWLTPQVSTGTRIERDLIRGDYRAHFYQRENGSWVKRSSREFTVASGPVAVALD